jgi:hypothetical protein
VGPGPTGEAPGGKVVLGGRIQHVLVSEIHVPKTLATPRYEVRLRYGERLEPWVVEVRPLR